ncbi:selenium-dependent molybdenum cofactor biosynthesis protein YqeB [Sporomusa sp.]|uniref:selenium-dependent molybdenum cofactor biosynthesis protein YqeB n=1 Tax=Sporomusa sp. TaxID=2078658 RepID=UPI002C62A292|nr:selenium-dependent molybdenum cofactor biosynthesis protein YqeB [Sporomusa sp.]HWR41754.1 selenium-dependent molybdenum cofactor biosynthesis protein YqeB [Sporomusa sp.]
MNRLIVIKGAGDMATGIAHRLFRSGFQIIMTELDKPTVIRRTVAFAEAVFTGMAVVEGIRAEKTEPNKALQIAAEGKIAVVIDAEAAIVKMCKPWGVIDSILAKRNMGTSIGDALVVIGVGPGFTAGVDVHAVVETKRGHFLGQVLTQGQALPDSGIPGEIGGYTQERILRAPCTGIFQSLCRITRQVKAGEVVAQVNGQPVRAAISGVLRGLLRDGLALTAGLKVGDIDPRCVPEHCYTISDKARAVAGGVLEGLFMMGNCLENKYLDQSKLSS